MLKISFTNLFRTPSICQTVSVSQTTKISDPLPVVLFQLLSASLHNAPAMFQTLATDPCMIQGHFWSRDRKHLNVCIMVKYSYFTFHNI